MSRGSIRVTDEPADVKLTTRGTVEEVKGELVINVSTLDRVVAGAESR